MKYFMTYDEVVEFFRSSKNATESFVGLLFRPKDRYFGFYEVYLDLEDQEWIGIRFQGGLLFSSCGEEEFYSLDDAPSEAKTLTYRNAKGMPDIDGLMSEYALKNLFPSLPDPEDMWTESDRLSFVEAVTEQFQRTAVAVGVEAV